MFVPTREYGRYGFVYDTPAFQTPIAAWSWSRNVRFKGGYIERALEPEEIQPPPAFAEPVMKGQQFYDGTLTRLIVATASSMHLLAADGLSWLDVTRASGAYTTLSDGYWQSFPWGDTVVFNNGVDIPQVYNPDTGLMVDLPKWGIITDDAGVVGTDTSARCRVIAPYKSFLVAINVTETVAGEQTNTVWWSDSYTSPKLWLDQGVDSYHWDYNSTTNLAGKNLVGMEDGPLQWALSLGEGIILYNTKSAMQMLFIGGAFVMDFRRLFDYGCVGIYGAAEFNNFHYVVGPDVMYVHDGNVVKQIAEDRVRDWFYNPSAGGGGVKNLSTTVRVLTDYTNREIFIQFDSDPGDDEFVTNASDPNRLALVYNYEDDNYTVIDATVDIDNALVPVVDMVYGLDLADTDAGEIALLWDNAALPWDSYGETRWNSNAQVSDVGVLWLTGDKLFRANIVSTPAPNKSYVVRKTNIDLDDLSPEMTTNLWKHLRQMYPHILADGSMQVRFGWSSNLQLAPIWDDYITYTFTVDNKVDTRTTGRYLAMEFTFEDTTAMRFTGSDIDVLPVYGR